MTNKEALRDRLEKVYGQHISRYTSLNKTMGYIKEYLLSFEEEFKRYKGVVSVDKSSGSLMRIQIEGVSLTFKKLDDRITVSLNNGMMHIAVLFPSDDGLCTTEDGEMLSAEMMDEFIGKVFVRR